MDTYYLVDYENVGSGGVSKCGSLEKTDHLHIFYTENSKKIDLDIVDNHGNAAFETHKVPTKSQSVDMHIVSYMGYLIGKHLGGNIKIVIISKDKDYDNLIKFWGDKAEITRKQKIEGSTKKTSKDDIKTQQSKSITEKSVKAELKTQLNSEIQKILSQNGDEQTEITKIAKLVGKRYGKENMKNSVHNDLRREYTDYDEIYKLIKPLLSKYI